MKKKNLEIYESLKRMHPEAACELGFSSPFELLVAVILSAQCTDKRVNLVTDKLFKLYNTPTQFASLSEEELGRHIFSCGFYKNKAKNIIAMSKSLLENFDGEVPDTMDKLLSLQGVGRKTASVVLNVAFNQPAMPVDTHVFRVSRRLGLSAADTPEGVEKDLCAAFDRAYWNDLHHYLIFHGRYICHSQRPDCGNCLFFEKDFCYYDTKNKIIRRVDERGERT